MFEFLKKNEGGKRTVFKIDGMHCVSCSMNIDGALEDMDGVYEAKTSYAKGETVVRWNPEKVTEEKLRKTIESLGYAVAK